MGKYLWPFLICLCACSSPPRTKWTDVSMRVFVDPDGIDPENYTRIVNALVSSERFSVVDRAEAFRAIKKEQERQHRHESGRFEDREKWAWWGKLLGARTIIVPHVSCRTDQTFWNRDRAERKCLQSLQGANANTGEIFVTVEGTNSAPVSHDMPFIVPDWDDTVANFVEKYPTEWEKHNYNENVRLYQDVSKERAIRETAEETPGSKVRGP